MVRERVHRDRAQSGICASQRAASLAAASFPALPAGARQRARAGRRRGGAGAVRSTPRSPIQPEQRLRGGLDSRPRRRGRRARGRVDAVEGRGSAATGTPPSPTASQSEVTPFSRSASMASLVCPGSGRSWRWRTSQPVTAAPIARPLRDERGEPRIAGIGRDVARGVRADGWRGRPGHRWPARPRRPSRRNVRDTRLAQHTFDEAAATARGSAPGTRRPGIARHQAGPSWGSA